MAESNNGGVYIESSIDNRKLAAGAEQARRIIESIGQAAAKAGGQIDDSLTPDSSRLRSELNKANAQLKRLGNSAVQEGDRINAAFRKIAAGIGAAFTVQKAMEFVSSMVRVRSEIAKLEISFNSLLGDKGKASSLLGEIRQFAASTPMMLGDLAKAAQMMLGFNVAAEEVMPMLRALGDISMGDAGRFQSLALAFSQMSATGKLMGQDLLQMINAGFNPLITISEKTGKSVKQLKEEMSEGAITAEMVTQAFKDAAGEGGKFNGILENQAKSVAGSIAYMRGAWENLLNELGKRTEGVMASSFNSVGDLLKDYERLGEVIKEVAIAVGTYKAALITCNVVSAVSRQLTQRRTVAELAHIHVLIAQRKAQQALNKTILANPYVLVAAAVAAVAAGMYRLATAQNAAERAQSRLNKTMDEMNREYAAERVQIDTLFARLKAAKKGSEEYKNVKDSIISQYGDYLKGLGEEIQSLNDVEGAYKAVRKAAEDAAKARAIGTATKNAADEYADKEAKARKAIYSTLEERFGDQEGEDGIRLVDAYYWRIVKHIEDGETAIDDIISRVGDKQIVLPSLGLFGFTKEWGKVSPLKAILGGLESARKVYNKEMAEAERMFGKAPLKADGGGGGDKPDPVKNKSYWDDLKKEAENELAALTDIEAAGAKGQALKAKIEQYSKKLAVFDANAKGSAKSNDDTEKKEKALADALADEAAQLEMKAQQQAIDAMRDGHERKMKQLEQDYKEELAAVDKWEKEQIQKEEELQKEKYKNAHGGSLTGFALDTATDNYTKIQELAGEKREQARESNARALAEQKEAEEQAALNYLATWGRIYQKKEALQKLYATKITKAETQGEKDSLAKELEEKLSGLNMEELKDTINWDLVFSGIEHATQKQLKAVRKQLEAFKNSEEYKTATPENIKAITEAIANIDSALAEKSGFFGGLSNAIRDYRKALEESKKAQEKLNKAIEAGDKASIEDAQKKKNSADNRLQQTGNAVGKAADTVGGKFKTLANVMGNLSKESVSLSDVGGAIEQVTAALGASGSKWAGLVAGILSLLDVAATDVEGFTEGLTKKIGAALASLTAYFVKTATFGLVDIGPASYKEYEKVYAQYEKMMNLWEDLIRKQKEFLEQAVGGEAIKAAAALRRTLEAEIDAAKATASKRLDSGASTGSHSISYRMWRGSYKSVDGQNWQDVAGAISGRLGVRFNSMYDMLSMSAEQLQWIKENYTNLWAAMDGDFADLLDKIIAKQEDVADIVDKTKESLTQVSFDSMYDSFTERLLDMESDAEDFADDFSGYLQKAVTSVMADKYKGKLKDWYDAFAAGNEDGEITQAELENLKAKWQEISEEAVKERDALAKIYGWESSSSREASAKGIATASQESVDENNGRLTAIQGHTYQITEAVRVLREQQAVLAGNTAGILQSVLAIEEHTGSMSERMKSVENGIEAVKNAVNDISLRGIKMR